MNQDAIQENLQQLKASEKTLSILADGIFARSLGDNIVIYWSKSAHKLYGFNEKEAIGKVKFQLLQSGPADVLQRADEHLAKHGYWKGTLAHKRKDGETIYVESTWILSKDLDNTPLYIFELSRNITQQVTNRQITTFKDEVFSTIKRLPRREIVLQVASELATKGFCDFCVVHHKLTEKFYTTSDKGISPLVTEALKGLFSRVQKRELLYEIQDGVYVPAIETINENLPFSVPGLKALLKKSSVTSLIFIPIRVAENTTAVMIFGTVSGGNVSVFSGNHFKVAQDVGDEIASRNEQLYLQSQLSTERYRLESLVETVPGVVWEAQKSMDSGQIMTYISKDIESLLGYPVEEWLSTPDFWLTIMHPEDVVTARKAVETQYKSDKPGINLFRWKKVDGTFIWVELRSITVLDESGKLTGMRGVATDVTERIEKDEQKDIFINMASHELKTPVATLKVYAQLLEKKMKETGDFPFLTYLSKILRQADHITNLINDLLNVSRIEQGKLVYQFERIKVVGFLSSLIRELDLLFSTHELRLDVKISKNIQVLADPEKLKQVVVNLVTNAVKYSPEADCVDISLRSNKGKLHITIQDYGIGIPKSDHGKVFEKYYRSEVSDNGTFSGLGVGLFITKEIINKHKGSITVKSRKGAGSSFTIILPTIK